MALFPALAQDVVSVNGTQKLTALITPDAKVRNYVFAAEGAIYIGAAGVTDANGLALAAGDVVRAAVDSSEADEFYFYAAAPQNLRVEQYG